MSEPIDDPRDQYHLETPAQADMRRRFDREFAALSAQFQFCTCKARMVNEPCPVHEFSDEGLR